MHDCCFWKFERLQDIRELEKIEPQWPVLELWLKVSDSNAYSWLDEQLFKYIPDEKLDEALNWWLNRERRLRFNPSPLDARRLVKNAKLLLDRGANLYSKDPDEARSSIRALVDITELLQRWAVVVDLSKLSPYMCCPLLFRQGMREVIFDPHRVAPLSCLAARNLPHSKITLDLPRGLRLYVEAHQELRCPSPSRLLVDY